MKLSTTRTTRTHEELFSCREQSLEKATSHWLGISASACATLACAMLLRPQMDGVLESEHEKAGIGGKEQDGGKNVERDQPSK